MKTDTSCTCSGCGKKYTYGDENSPVVLNRIWAKLLEFYRITEDEEYAREKKFLKLYKKWKEASGEEKEAIHEKMCGPEYHVYFCTDCIEKALGRKITKHDIQLCPYNEEFMAKYFKEGEGK